MFVGDSENDFINADSNLSTLFSISALSQSNNNYWTISEAMELSNDTSLMGGDDVVDPVMKDCLFGSRLQLLRIVCEVMMSLPVAMVGILGNLVSLIVLRRQRPYLTTTLILQALIITDIIILLIVIQVRCLPVMYSCGVSGLRDYYYSYFEPTYHYLFPAVFVFRFIETWLTVLLTVERFIVVYRPLHAHRLCTAARIYRYVTVVVITATVFSIPRFFERFMAEFRETNAVRAYNTIYRIALFFIAMYALPMAILITLNIRLLLALKRANLQRAELAMYQLTDRHRDGGADGRASSRAQGQGQRKQPAAIAAHSADVVADGNVHDKQQVAPASAPHHTYSPLRRLSKTMDQTYKTAAPHAGVGCVPDEDGDDQPPPAYDAPYQLMVTRIANDYVAHDENGRPRNSSVRQQHGIAHQQHKQQQEHQKRTAPQGYAQSSQQRHQTADQRQRSRGLSLTPSVINNSNRSVTITIVCLVATFMVCNMGAVVSHTLWSLTNFSSLAWLEDHRRQIAHVSNVLTTVNSSANFVVCCLCSRLFRRTLVGLFRRPRRNSRK